MDSENTSSNIENDNIGLMQQDLLNDNNDIITEMTEEAKIKAVKHIKGLLRRPEHLDKVCKLTNIIFVFLFNENLSYQILFQELKRK